MYASVSTTIVTVKVSPGVWVKMTVEQFKSRFKAGFYKGKGVLRPK